MMLPRTIYSIEGYTPPLQKCFGGFLSYFLCFFSSSGQIIFLIIFFKTFLLLFCRCFLFLFLFSLCVCAHFVVVVVFNTHTHDQKAISLQGRATKIMKGLEDKRYREQLRSLDLFCSEQSRLRAGLMVTHSSSQRGRRAALISALWLQGQDLSKWHGAESGESQVEGQEKVLHQRVVGDCKRFPRAVIMASS